MQEMWKSGSCELQAAGSEAQLSGESQALDQSLGQNIRGPSVWDRLSNGKGENLWVMCRIMGDHREYSLSVITAIFSPPRVQFTPAPSKNKSGPTPGLWGNWKVDNSHWGMGLVHCPYTDTGYYKVLFFLQSTKQTTSLQLWSWMICCKIYPMPVSLSGWRRPSTGGDWQVDHGACVQRNRHSKSCYFL